MNTASTRAVWIVVMILSAQAISVHNNVDLATGGSNDFVVHRVPPSPFPRNGTKNVLVSNFNDILLWSYFPLAFAMFWFLFVSVIMWQVPNEHLIEWEAERLFMKHNGEFDKFWISLVRETPQFQKKFLGELCMLSQSFSPREVDAVEQAEIVIEAPKEVAPAPKEAAKPKEVEAFPETEIVNAQPGAIPISLNGVIPQGLSKAKKNELLEGKLNSMFRLYRESMSRMKSPERSSFLELEVNPPEIRIVDKDKSLKTAASQCWEQLKEKVLDMRDMRNWRLAIKKALRSAAFFFAAVLLLGVATTVDLSLSGNDGVGKRASGLFRKQCTIDSLKDAVCMNTELQICRTPCPNGVDFVFNTCFIDETNAYWVPMNKCP